MRVRRIVMLDDSKTVLLLCSSALREAGYEVSTATTPEQLDLGAMNEADLVLVDVNMPEIFGDDLVRILRADYAVKAPIYLYSTIERNEGVVRARDAGADGFLQKHDPQTLVSEVTALLRAREAKENEENWFAQSRERLKTALREHADKVDVLAVAHRDVDPRIPRTAIARELHDAAGESAMMGFSAIRDLTSELNALLRDPMVIVPEACFPQIAAWFRTVCSLVLNELESGASASPARDEMAREARELARALVRTNTPTFRPDAPVAVDEDPAATGRRVLVIDDSAVVRTLLGSALGDMGYPVETARDLDEASAKLFEFRPELVITDVSLPGIEGDEVCRRIKASSHRLIPVIFYSGLPRAELQTRARAAGAEGFVNKEDGFDALTRCIHKLFQEVVLY